MSRFVGLTFFTVIMSLVTAARADEPAGSSKMHVYIGTYTEDREEGVFLLDMDTSTGALSNPRSFDLGKNPAFLAIHPTGKYLYAVGEVEDFNGKPGGGVTAAAIDPATGALKVINSQSSGGGGPCHLSVDRTGRCVLVANYGAGSVASLPIAEGGKLEPANSVIQHKGKSVDKSRQNEPHAHSFNIDLNNRFAFAADLGCDKIFIYKLDPGHASLAYNDPEFVSVAPGSGPRHFAFHPTGKFAFVINEMKSTLTSFAYDASRGALEEIETVATLPADFKGDSTTAEVQVHPSGKFVYGSNRGHDSIAVFAFDEKARKLSLVEHESTQGKTPRNFGIDPAGKFLLAANQDTGTVVVFRIDPETGKLEPTGSKASIPKAVCVKFLPK